MDVTSAAMGLIDTANALTFDASEDDSPFMEDDYDTTYVMAVASILELLYALLLYDMGRDPLLYEVPYYVYGDLLYRGFDPFESWVESGITSVYGEPGDDEFAPGSYYVVPSHVHGYVAGVMVGKSTMMTFDCKIAQITAWQKTQARRIMPEQLPEVLDDLANTLLSDIRSRRDLFVQGPLHLVWGDGPLNHGGRPEAEQV